MTQTNLFDMGREPVAQRCGTCVTRNAASTDQPSGFCTIAAENRAHDAPPCGQWFGLDQLRASLYGKG